jgi:DNA-binding NarL/FixJ family response regulator
MPPTRVVELGETQGATVCLLVLGGRTEVDRALELLDAAEGPAVAATPTRRARDSRIETLTAREYEVLQLLARAASNTAISDQLGITTRAVERHINSIFRKLELAESDRLNRRVKAALLYASAG